RRVATELPPTTAEEDHALLVAAIDGYCTDYDYLAAMTIISATQQLDASVVTKLQSQVMQRAVERFNELLDGQDYDEAYSHATKLRRLFGRQDIVDLMMRKAKLGLKLDHGNPDTPFKPIHHEESV
ncbi:MAG: hypothetical protein KDB23_33630, partial [Planctomycetales bacterium]|nr:hypothetical protein [Planctomycetales bacterium]